MNEEIWLSLESYSKTLITDSTSWIPSSRPESTQIMAYQEMLKSFQLVPQNIQISSRFKESFGNIEDLVLGIVREIHHYMITNYVSVYKYFIDVYDISEDPYLRELRPYIEAHVYIDSLNKLMKMWENVIRHIKKVYGEQGDRILDNVDIFLTRA